MLVDIELQQLVCNGQSSGDGSRPYLWTELLQVDDNTLSSGIGVADVDHAASPIGAQVLISEGMRAGDSAPVPDDIGHLRTRFVLPMQRRVAILVAALWDQRDTPGAAVVAGYIAFLDAVRDALAHNLAALAAGMDDTTIASIKQDVHDKVQAAIEGQLNDVEKGEFAIGVKTPDSLIDSAFAVFEQQNVSEPIALRFGAGSSDDFQVNGQLVVTQDPCENELLAVSSIENAIANIKGGLRQLGNAHGGEPRPEDQEEMHQLEQALHAEQANLNTAEQALQKCRQRVVVTGAELSDAQAPPTSTRPPVVAGTHVARLDSA